jgi:hypothetical protein
MEKRNYGTNPMAECRRDAHDTVDKNKRYRQIKQILKTHKRGLTAKEIAVLMYRKGLTPNTDRNNAAPRLTELCENGFVEPIGKKLCKYTGKKVTVYQLRDQG